MAALRKEAYVPPHLRKQNVTNGAKRDSKTGLTTVNESPAASDMSKTEHVAHFHSSP